jgi:hypothetical protein
VRLPWPFGRSTSGAGSTSGSAAGGTSAAPAGSSTRADAPVAPTGAWRTLPPIQRTAGPPPVVAPAAPFLAGVPGHAPLPPIVTPLGHESSPSAPAGIVVAHTRAVPSLTSHAPLPTRPLQRHASAGHDAVPIAGPEPEPVVSGSATAASSVADPGAAAVTSVPLSDEPELPPIRTVATVSRSATVQPSTRPLTQASSTLSPLPVAAPRTPASARDARSAAPATLALPLQASGRIPAGATGAPVDGSGSTRPSMPVRRVSEPSASAPAAATAAAAGSGRRAGLGAPVPVAPATAVAQRLPIRPDAAPARPGAPMVQADAAFPALASTIASPAGHGHSAPTPARPLPVLPVARQHRDAATPSTVPATASNTPAVTTGSPAGTRTPATVVPTLGARPLRPTTSSSGAVAQRSTTGDDGGGNPDDAPLPVAARWDTGDALPATITSIPAGPDDRPGGMPVQLSPIAGAAPAAAAPSAAPATREIVFPAPGLDLQGGGPAWSTAAPATPVAPIAPSRAPGAASPARTASPLNLARSVAPAAPSPDAPAAVPNAPVVARIVADPSTPGAPPTVQTSPNGTGIPVATITATPVQRAAEEPQGQEPEPDGARSDKELDELARDLFGRIRTQLRTEVIHEREAKGLTFDAF